MRGIKIFNRILGICTLAMALNACVCDPPPERNEFESISHNYYQYFYDSSTTFTLGLEVKYARRDTPKKRKFGCMGYYKVLSISYGETLNWDSAQLTCSSTVGPVIAGQNWINHPTTSTHKEENITGSPPSYLNVSHRIGKWQLSQLKDSLTFYIKGKTSANKTYTDSFRVGVIH